MEAAGKRYILHRSRSDVFRIWHMSDLHLMSKSCAETEIKRDIAEIRDDPFSFWVGGGDMVDCIAYTDKRFDPDAVAPWVSISDLGKLGKVGMEKARQLFMPIKEKCLGMCLGNHEEKYQLHKDQKDLHSWLCTELGVPNLGYSAIFDLVFVRTAKAKQPTLAYTAPKDMGSCQSFRVYIHHGAGAATTPGGKLNRLVQFMNSFRADLYFCGHVHDKTARREPCLGGNAGCDDIMQFDRLGVISGSYLKTYQKGTTGYGEQKGYRPTSLGAAIVTIHPETRKMEAAI